MITIGSRNRYVMGLYIKQGTDNEVCEYKFCTDSESDRRRGSRYAYCTDNETLVYYYSLKQNTNRERMRKA
jgi:hypothetical protein